MVFYVAYNPAVSSYAGICIVSRDRPHLYRVESHTFSPNSCYVRLSFAPSVFKKIRPFISTQITWSFPGLLLVNPHPPPPPPPPPPPVGQWNRCIVVPRKRRTAEPRFHIFLTPWLHKEKKKKKQLLQSFAWHDDDAKGVKKRKRKQNKKVLAKFLLYWCYYQHRSRELVSPVCGTFFNNQDFLNCYCKTFVIFDDPQRATKQHK